MKKFEDLNYYEILEIPVSASNFEIRQAYRDTLSIYSEDSLETYSMFSDDERHTILNRIEKAFKTLIDRKSRDEYDKILVNSDNFIASSLEEKDQKEPIPLFPSSNNANEKTFSKRLKMRIEENDTSQEISEEILSKDIITGNDLKRLREAFGVELEDIYEAARITISTLQSIEENRTEDLPPDVILKNFLKKYAELLQIDPKKIIDGYLKNIHHINSQNILSS